MLNPRTFSFGSTSAIVTSMGLIIGLGTATVSQRLLWVGC